MSNIVGTQRLLASPHGKTTPVVKCVPQLAAHKWLWIYVRSLGGSPEAEAEGLGTDGNR